MNDNIAVLLSGGVDSSLVVHLLCSQGYKPHLFYILIGNMDKTPDCSGEEDIEICKYIAYKYGLPFDVIDLHAEYWDKVVSYIVSQSAKGLTPNPDVMCNKLIKFGCFEDKCGKDYSIIATGHYANKIFENDKYWLATAKDKVKDQTDFLCQINYKQLSKLIFPIGGLSKEEVREVAKNVQLPSAYRRDSQGICFLGKINYRDLLTQYLGEKKGEIIEYKTGKRLGSHDGYWFYTLGQRKGLGLPQGPWFVVKKDIEQNIVYVSNQEDLNSFNTQIFALNGLHFITDNPGFGKEAVEITFKIRHSPEFIQGKIYQKEDNRWIIESDIAINGVSPGQFGVVYDKTSHICYGSGEIELID